MQIASVISIIFVMLFTTTVFVLVYLDYRKERRMYYEKRDQLEKLKEIFELEDLGICKSCNHGCDKCIREGRAYCKEDTDNAKDR